MDQKQIIKTHRVGTVTFGVLLVLFGILFIVHIFVPELDYRVIFRLWPCIFIFLGLEVLVGNHKVSKIENEETGNTVNFVYDKAAIFLMICLFFFAMLMAAVDYSIQYENVIYTTLW
ncbi:MAG: hypothetical protein GX235_10445 [Clostridiales bacterium]|nr:hypothetical protein [Clostridiales bacterium]